MAAIKNIALTGATGSFGSVLLERLVASGKFNITLLKRQGSSSKLPSGFKVVDVDFESVDSLKTALEGQDAVISATGSTSIASQKALIDASIAAGIKRYIPSEFGSDTDVPQTRVLPVYGHKVEMQDYLAEKSKTTDLTYTLVFNSAFLDWGLQHSFLLDVSNYKPTIVNSGDDIFSATTLSSVGDAVVGVLTHLEETKNRSVRVEDIKISQNQLLAIAKKIAPEKPWESKTMNLNDAIAESDAQLAAGTFNFGTFIPYLYRAIMEPGYGGNFTTTDNELLGIKGNKTEKDVIEILKPLLK